jgi:hypothetical protein
LAEPSHISTVDELAAGLRALHRIDREAAGSG